MCSSLLLGGANFYDLLMNVLLGNGDYVIFFSPLAFRIIGDFIKCALNIKQMIFPPKKGLTAVLSCWWSRSVCDEFEVPT